MTDNKNEKKITQEVSTAPEKGPELNEVDGDPIFHADEEEGDHNE